MALIGNNQLTVGVAGATLAGTSIENTQIPLPTTIFRVETVDANGVNPGDPDYIPTYASQDNIILNNGGSSLTVPEDYTLAIFGGIEGAGDSTTGFLKVDGASIQVSTMPDRAFRDSDFPLGFNGATFQYVGTDLARAGGQRWPENSASGRVAVDFRNCKVIGQDVSLYAGITDTRNNGWLFHLGAADTGVAFDRTGSLAGGDLQDRFSGASFDGIQFFGAITQQIPADVNFISVAFNDYNKAVAPEINNLRITAPKGPGVVRTVIKDGVMPFGTGIRAQAADGKVIIILADTDAFAPYQDPATYAEGVTNVFISNYPQIVTGGVNSGGGGSFWRGYGWKPALLDVSTSIQIPDGFIDFNLPAGDFVIFPSSINTAIPQIRANNGTGAISHTVTGGDNEGYWVITSNANDVAQRNVTPNIDTAVVFTPATPYFMDYLVLANIMPQHVPTGGTVESFDETQVQQVQYSPDALVGDFTFDTANDATTGNSNATQAYAALKLAHKDGSVGIFGDAVDTSTNGGAQVSFNGNLVFSGTLPTALTNTGNAAIRVGSGFVGGSNNGATHNRYSASQITLASGTTYDTLALEATTGSIICIGASLNSGVILNGNIVSLPTTFAGTIETGSAIVVGATTTYNFEGASFGDVTVTSNEIGGVDVTVEGSFTGNLVAGTGVNNLIISVPSETRVITPNLDGRLFIERISDGLDVIGTSAGLAVTGGTALPAIEFGGTGDALIGTDVVRTYFIPSDTAFLPAVYETTLATATAVSVARNGLLYASSSVTTGTTIGTPVAGSVAAGNDGILVMFDTSHGVGDTQRALLLVQTLDAFFALFYRVNSGIGAGGTFITNFVDGAASGAATYNSDYVQLSSDDTSVSIQRVLTDVSPTGTEPAGALSTFRAFIVGTQLFSVLYDRSNNATTGQIETIFRGANDAIIENQNEIADKISEASNFIPVDNILTNS